jgi:hypothetical protein
MFFASVRRGRAGIAGVQVNAIVERITAEIMDNVTIVLTDDGRGGESYILYTGQISL